MESLTFKYFGLTPIYSLMSKELEKKVEFIQSSKIDALPIFTTTDILFEDEIMDILNCQNMEYLSLLLRNKKVNKLLKKSKPSLNYEFLSFWYNNYNNLFLLMPS